MKLTKEDKKRLVEALLPLEVLYYQIESNPYKEMTKDFQHEVQDSIMRLRGMILNSEVVD